MLPTVGEGRKGREWEAYVMELGVAWFYHRLFLLKAQTVYRGISGGVLPEEFWKPNKQNVRGGVEFGFMSTTANQEVALAYASGGSAVGTD